MVKTFKVGLGNFQPNNTSTGANNIIIGTNQHLDSNSQFQCRIGDGFGYQETFDMRSMFLIIKTLLKESSYNEELIYMEYDELNQLLNRESNINEILESDK